MLRGLRSPIARALEDAAADIAAHQAANDPCEDTLVAGAFGLLRLIATIGEEICRTIEALHRPSAD